MKQQLHQTENRAEAWLKLTEQTFHFVTYARQAFINGTLLQKREILAALGQNFSLKDKKIVIEPHEWLVHIEKAYPDLEAEFKRVELNKTLTNEERNAVFASLITRWGAIVEAVRKYYQNTNDTAMYIPPLRQLEKSETNKSDMLLAA